MTTSDKKTDAKKRIGRARANQTILTHLATGSTLEQAAEAAGVSLSTVARRLQEPGFQRLLEATQSYLFRETLGRLVGMNGKAAQTLEALLGDDVPAAQRLGAAKAVFDASLRFRSEISLAERMAAIEQALGIAAPRPTLPATPTTPAPTNQHTDEDDDDGDDE